ncbi:acyl-CoA dehydrogenase family protein [Phytohabitans kaempferiae]|uniref:Acyl-CoA dehydrogenase family protein n=1 Tax=Phytohabitans kaempferiae TaxID=1620943 RepID=A0ABV6MAL5_9ACTN
MPTDQIAAGSVPSRFGPLPAHPVLERLREVIDRTIAPTMTETDRGAVPASHLAALAGTGLFGLAIPAEYGGLGAPPEVVTEAYEMLAGACPSTYLVASQHATPARSILDGGGPALRELLPALASGGLFGGAAFGHVRTWPGRRTVTARRVADGWRFHGVAPWFSGAGLIDLVLLAAIAEAERTIIFAAVPLPRPGRVQPVPLNLAAIAGSRTVALHIHDLFVPDDDVTQLVDVDRWKGSDGRDGPTTAPGALGLARTAIEYALTRQPDNPGLNALADEIASLRATGPGGDPFARHAHSVNLAVRATNAAIVARGGAALLADDPAQVWARAATFLQVRGLSEPLRAAHLRQLTHRTGR